MTTTAQQLQQIACHWPDLVDALGVPVAASWPPAGLRHYLAALEQHDTAEAAALRALERSPDQLGTRPVPISLRVHDTMRLVEAALVECADNIAAHVQRPPVSPPAPRRATIARTRADRVAWEDHARRIQAARDDAMDPRRWKWSGTRPSAPYAALWLLGRVQGAPGPFRPLQAQPLRQVATVAAGALHRVEAALDLADGRRELTSSHPCACGGTIEIRGGAGAAPRARCTNCGAYWTEAGVIAA
ncbi:hypothetical protein [Streptomyces sp.]|uniref:hypothetical protein n=1 Tax=Streptomyces sp. TaxID=1931 RepID=UPI002F9275CC